MSDRFRAILAEQTGGKFSCAIRELPISSLPQEEVSIAVEYSSLNYKDGLTVTGQPGLIRSFPMVPGIDLAGTVESSSNNAWKAGDRVVLTGWGIGEQHWGGYAGRASAPADWLIRLPPALTAKQAMAIGTAGFTAMMSVLALEDHGLKPENGEVLVTGAAGGVGSVAIAILAKLGYRVVASTGRAQLTDYLRGLGAGEIADRAQFSQPSKKPLDRERWAGAIDSVGGATLVNVLRGMKFFSSAASCGLAGGGNLPDATVYPFILRGVNLLGIQSVYCPRPRRQETWDRLARDLPLDKLDEMTEVIPLAEVLPRGQEIVQGKVRGRIVVDVNA